MITRSTVKFPVFDVNALYAVAADRGYDKKAALTKLRETLGIKANNTVRDKLERRGRPTYKDVVKISNAFEMTPTEFLRVFFKDCFQEKPSGKVVFSVPDSVIETMDSTGWLPEQEQAYRDLMRRRMHVKWKIEKELMEQYGEWHGWWLKEKDALKMREQQNEED